MDLKAVYKEREALLEGHFLLSSGKHSQFYLQSAKVLEDPKLAKELLSALAKQIEASGLTVDAVASPALGGLLAGYELASALGVRFIFTERVEGQMTLRRGFSVSKGEKILVCEDIITTGGSAMECKAVVESLGAEVVAFGAIANRGFCPRIDLAELSASGLGRARSGSDVTSKTNCKLPKNLPFFALDDFLFEAYEPDNCPLCKTGTKAYKPGSRGN